MTNENPRHPLNQEPTVLDLYKSVTKDWQSLFNFLRSLWDARRRTDLNNALADEVARSVAENPLQEQPALTGNFPWRTILAFLLGALAQFLLEPPNRQGNLAIALYILSCGMGAWAYFRNEWQLPSLPLASQRADDLSTRAMPFILSIILASIAFWSFGQDVFTLSNLSLWILSIGLFFRGFWLKDIKKGVNSTNLEDIRRKIIHWLPLLIVFGIAILFRLYRIGAVPAEPFSDHAEKILDVYDISQGQYKIFFTRNTGREAIQMYWTLLVSFIFQTGLSFLSLKLGTALIGILTLPYVYLLGKEYGGDRAGLFALFLFGVAYWPNVISRIGLRFPLYPVFVAPLLYYLIRGLRCQNRNDFLLAGLFLGLGLHGYSPFRIVPFLVVAAFVIYVLHERSRGKSIQSAWWLTILVVVSLLVFLPLLRFWLGHPDIFGYRAMTRLTSTETALSAPALQVFFSNLYKALLMFNWDNGSIWVHSIPGRPALDVISAVLFVIGIVLLVLRYIRQREWRDLLLLVSIPILLMPSILSLAFPGENPSLNRTGGASVVAFVVCGLAMEALFTSLSARKNRLLITRGLTILLFLAVAYQNFGLVFNKFDQSFKLGAWNTSEMGSVISDFRDRYGNTDSVWIVPYPYWVDTRLPGVWAGIPNRDFALWQPDFEKTLSVPAPKLIMYRVDDLATETALKVLYPHGVYQRYVSKYPGKDFIILMIGQ